MNRKQVAAITLILWLTIILVFLRLVQRFGPEFFSVMLIGILVIVGLIKHQYLRPGYRHYPGHLTGAGIVVSAIIIDLNFLEIRL